MEAKADQAGGIGIGRRMAGYAGDPGIDQQSVAHRPGFPDGQPGFPDRSVGDGVQHSVPSPAYVGGDLGIYKNFKVRESQSAQFRFTAFNFLNHPNGQFGLTNDINLSFAAPGGGNTNPVTNGKPGFTVGRRVVEIALKYNF